MKFTKRDNGPENNSINEWECGQWAIVELAFLFGQHRVQIWNHRPHCKYHRRGGAQLLNLQSRDGP